MILRSETELQPKDHDRLLLEITSLRGLLNTLLLQYHSAGHDFEVCSGIDKHHAPTSSRKVKLFLKTKRLREAIAEMHTLFRLNPESKYVGYEVELLEELIDEVKGEPRFELKKEFNSLMCEDEEEEEETSRFEHVKIEKAPSKKGKTKRLDFGADSEHAIEKTEAEMQPRPAPALDKVDREENEYLIEYLAEQELNEPPPPPSVFNFSRMDQTKSILKMSTFNNATSSSASKCHLLQFNVSVIKDIDGKMLCSGTKARVGKSMVVEQDAVGGSVYRPRAEPTRSMMKMNGSFCANKFNSVMKEKKLDISVGDKEDCATKLGFGRVKNI